MVSCDFSDFTFHYRQYDHGLYHSDCSVSRFWVQSCGENCIVYSESSIPVPRDSWPYFTVSNLRFPQAGGTGACIYSLPARNSRCYLLYSLGADRKENTASSSTLGACWFSASEVCLARRCLVSACSSSIISALSRNVTISYFTLCQKIRKSSIWDYWIACKINICYMLWHYRQSVASRAHQGQSMIYRTMCTSTHFMWGDL
jgi:hypothetical protein